MTAGRDARWSTACEYHGRLSRATAGWANDTPEDGRQPPTPVPGVPRPHRTSASPQGRMGVYSTNHSPFKDWGCAFVALN